jgi:hypothetical protein
MSDQLDDICERLRAISDQLGDLALDRLREAVADGATKAPADEKRFTRARRSVDKAIALLSQGGGDF